MMRKYLSLPIILILIIIVACENFDNTPPVVAIDSPVALSAVSGITLVEITATDDEEMSHVELFVDGLATGRRDSTLPYILEWNTYGYDNQSDHVLAVRAWDASENYSDSEPVKIVVDNTPEYPKVIDFIQIVFEDMGFTLSWDKSTDEDFAAYQLKKFTNTLLDSFVVVFEGTDVNTHTYHDTDIDPLVQYFYRVAVIDSFGLSSTGIHNLSPSPSIYVPTGLSASSSENTIKLRWNDNTPFEEGFRLERDDGVGFKQIALVGPDTTGYTDADMEYDIQYRYRVAAYTATNQTSYSFISSIYSPLKYAPSDLAASSNDTTITLTWHDNSLFEAGYRLERSEGAGYVQIAELGENTTTYTDRDLEEDEYYSYRVAAFTPTSQSSYSFSTGIYSPIEFAPSALTYSTTESSVILRWTDNCIFESGFKLERDEGQGFVEIADLASNTTGYTDSNLVYDLNYRYQVAAYTSAKQSKYSSILSLTSPLQFAPSNLSATATATTISLVWKDNASFESGFRVERRTDVGYVQIAELAADVTTYIDSDLVEDEFYSYRVAAFTATSQSSYASTVSISSPIQFAPSNLSATTADTTITLRWTDNCIFETGFSIERDDGVGFVQIGTVGTNTTAYTDLSMEYGIQYRYRVRAFTATRFSNYSFTTTVASPLKFTPTNLELVAGDTTILLIWEDQSIFEDGFRVERDAGIGYVQIAELGVNIETYTDNDLLEGITYSYRVAAFTTTAQSNYSSSKSILSPITFTPSGLTATPSDTSIVLRWTDNSYFETGFNIERDDGTGFSQIGSVGTDTTAYTDHNMVYDVEYRYRVKAFTASISSDYTSTVIVNSPLLYAPTDLELVAGDTTIILNWEDKCIFEDGFRVERDAGIGFVQIEELGANVETYTDNDLIEGAEYTYRVAAFTSGSQSDYTSEETIASPLIFAPTNLAATVSNNSVLLTWDDNCIFEDGFRIERNSGSGFSQIAEIGPNTTTYSDNYLAYNTEHEYRIAAFDGSDQSEYSSVVSAEISYLGMEWVTVTGGDYTFGETDVVTSDLLTDFEIMKFEVTNAQFVSFLEEVWATRSIIVTIDSVNGPFTNDGTWPTDDYLYYDFNQMDSRIDWNESYFTIEEGYENHPVVAVTWFGAYAYAQHYNWDLPTENQWEKAARGNTGNDYPWGDEEPTCDLANFSFCSDGTVPVGETSGVSPFGAYDLIGNAWEWIKTYDGTDRTIRGGSWSTYTSNLKAWHDIPADPRHSYYLIGFRCVR